MRFVKKKTIVSILLIFVMTMLVFGISPSSEISAKEKEFRGIWVSTVWNIDYPSKATTDMETLKKEAVTILDNVKNMGFNAVFLQVRPGSDAIYSSDIYPWSKYLTGIQGIAPKNNFDPLEFFIEEAHKREIELHAWINPYRITASPLDNNKLSPDNPAVLYPEATVIHKDGKLYYNPGVPKSREIIIEGIREILEKYDVDGIHLDDYFYPEKDFNDAHTFAEYGAGYSSIAEWRTDNINKLIREIGEAVHRIKPAVKFGVSPAGIWANKSTSLLGSETYGWETLTNQFADSRNWVKQGYIDYIIPQIYWNIGFNTADYAKLVEWWSDVVKDTNVRLYIGQAAYRAVDADAASVWFNGNEIKKQIELNRTKNYVSGYSMFSYKSFINNSSLFSMIKKINGAEIPVIAEEPQVPADKDNYNYYFIKYDKGYEEKEDYIVMYCENNGKKEILARSRYTSGEVVGITNKTGDLNVIYNEIDFDDIKDLPERDNLKYLASRNIILGYNGLFNPEQSIKRADFVLMLMRMLEIKEEENTVGFDDVPKEAYYSKALATAKKWGLIYGAGNNKFLPEQQITKQDIFVMTYRAIKALDMINNETINQLPDTCKDKDSVAEYAREPIAHFIGKNVIKLKDGILNPTKIANRAEVGDFLAELLKEGMN